MWSEDYLPGEGREAKKMGDALAGALQAAYHDHPASVRVELSADAYSLAERYKLDRLLRFFEIEVYLEPPGVGWDRPGYRFIVWKPR